jgi:hypothetical protein
MSPQKDGAPRGAASVARAQSTRPPLKWQRTLRALIERPALHRFQAERDPEIRDHCLPSTISDLEGRGLCIGRRLVAVPGFAGERAIVAEYQLDAENRARAREMLAGSASRGP